mgnify:FL=1
MQRATYSSHGGGEKGQNKHRLDNAPGVQHDSTWTRILSARWTLLVLFASLIAAVGYTLLRKLQIVSSEGAPSANAHLLGRRTQENQDSLLTPLKAGVRKLTVAAPFCYDLFVDSMLCGGHTAHRFSLRVQTNSWSSYQNMCAINTHVIHYLQFRGRAPRVKAKTAWGRRYKEHHPNPLMLETAGCCCSWLVLVLWEKIGRLGKQTGRKKKMAPTNLSICICGHHQSEGLRRGPVYCSGQYGHCHVLELFQGGLRNEDSLDVVRCIRNLEQHYCFKDDFLLSYHWAIACYPHITIVHNTTNCNHQIQIVD